MSACADRILLVHGLADGEVDAANALAIEAHLADCAGCRGEYDRILALRAALQAGAPGYAAPQGLRDGIAALLAETETTVVPLRRKPSGLAGHVLNWRWASGALTGLAAALVLTIAAPRPAPLPAPGGSDIVAGHVRSLLADHLLDVQTSDRHVVKPWFNGKIDFAPPVPDLAADGFPLAGGRLDVIDDREVAALVYHRRLHVINVFVAPTAGAPPAGDENHDGYTILRWRAGDLTFSAISDLNGKELREFRQLFIVAAAG